MAWLARTVMPGVPHHITQRGNNRQDVFFVDDDRRFYLELLKEQCDEHGLEIAAYCLMTNHLHLVATPGEPDSLALALGRMHMRYTQYVNRLHARSGHLWQNRFYSCPLGPGHRTKALVYVERNPVRARMVRHACNYKWSSAAAHAGGDDTSGLLDLASWRRGHSPDDWQARLSLPDDETFLAEIRAKTHRGRPLGSDSFISKLETLLGRRLHALSRGRPRTKASGEA